MADRRLVPQKRRGVLSLREDDEEFTDEWRRNNPSTEDLFGDGTPSPDPMAPYEKPVGQWPIEPGSSNNPALGRTTVGKFPDPGEAGSETIGGEDIPQFEDQLEMGIDYEMGQMVKPDRSIAIDTVMANLQQNPRYYLDLVMLGVQEQKHQQRQALKGILAELRGEKQDRDAYNASKNIRECTQHRLI